MTDPRLVEIFPVLGLRVACGPLELRSIGESEVLGLLEVARAGVHPPTWTPFAVPWTDAAEDELPLNYLQWWWRSMATWSRDAWDLNLAVLWNGELVGVQGVATRDFLTLRFGETGSWLGQRFQGLGIGTEMRRVMCTLLFDHLDFEFVTSAAFDDNLASLRVSEKVGYTQNGATWVSSRGERRTSTRLMLASEDLVRGEPISVEGVAGVRRLIGLDG